MRTERSALRTVTLRALGVAIGIVVIATTAHAACPDKRASCILHEEGVALFLEGKHQEAAAKFSAAIAAEPTARSYLGYAQAVESLGQIALAYDAMAAAFRLSTAELRASGGRDVEVTGRAERIKYKLGELRAKIGFVWLRVPDGVKPQRVVSVQRQGEGDLAQPLTQWTAVTPGRQVLIATIDDGTKLEIIAQIAAGAQGIMVIPVAAPPRPEAPVYVPPPVPPPIKTLISFGASLLAPGSRSSENGVPNGSVGGGFTALYERRLVSSIGLTTRLEYLAHPETSNFNFGPGALSVSGSEVVVLAGFRTWGARPSTAFHGRAGVGFSVFTQKATVSSTGMVADEFTRLYPALELGGGLNFGRLRIQSGILFTAAGDAKVTLGTRFMATLGIDLYRK